MGIDVSDSEFTDETTNDNTTFAIFYFYIVLRDAQVNSVFGYECSFTATDPAVLFLGASGDNGWTNFGDVDNHLVGFQMPRLVDGNGDVVLSSVVAIYLAGDPVDLIMGPSSPSTGDPNGNIWVIPRRLLLGLWAVPIPPSS